MNAICDGESGEIVGYVTLSAAQIERVWLPRSQHRSRPDPLPVTLLGQLVVRNDWKGQGHAASLLVFVLRTALVASETIGSIGVIAHPLDDSVGPFTVLTYGFDELSFDPRRAMMVRMVDLQRSGIG